MLTIIMLNIVVVRRFQKPWALTSALDSTGTTTCTGCPINLDAPLTVRALPPWVSSTVSVPPLASPPSFRAPAPVLSSYTVLLFIIGSYVIALGTKARAPTAPHSFLASS